MSKGILRLHATGCGWPCEPQIPLWSCVKLKTQRLNSLPQQKDRREQLQLQLLFAECRQYPVVSFDPHETSVRLVFLCPFDR